MMTAGDDMDIVIVTPAPPGSQHGNRNTALRWSAHLKALGHRVWVQVRWDGRPRDLMIALHARRSHESIARWRRMRGAAPLVLVLTGTDLYRDIRSDADAKASLDLADRLVVLQEKGLDELSPAHRSKASVVFQSVRKMFRQVPPKTYLLVTVIGHLREEKDPFRAALALAQLPAEVPVRVVHLGGAMSPEMKAEALDLVKADARYRWLGELPHAGAMRWLSRSHAMVISSRMEGGAHVVSEAISLGVPVLASRISGNVGLLGDDYAGYYPCADDAALTRLLRRSAEERKFLVSLEKQVKARRELVKPATERKSLKELLANF
jgi:putative glycosyltransferase (TIGR04348 family)